MRELKFRVWDEKYHYWDNSLITCYPNEVFKKQGRTIQLFTGLKDKNGKEIFEGDIIYHKNHKGYCQCIWDVERLTYRWVGENVSLPIDTRDDNMTLKEKIVGNIFETPNLIK